MDASSIENFLRTTATDLAVKVLAAIAFWIVGRWLIGKVVSLMPTPATKMIQVAG